MNSIIIVVINSFQTKPTGQLSDRIPYIVHQFTSHSEYKYYYYYKYDYKYYIISDSRKDAAACSGAYWNCPECKGAGVFILNLWIFWAFTPHVRALVWKPFPLSLSLSLTSYSTNAWPHLKRPSSKEVRVLPSHDHVGAFPGPPAAEVDIHLRLGVWK